jgi:hypothetical protein
LADRIQSYQTLFVRGLGLGPALPKQHSQELVITKVTVSIFRRRLFLNIE